MLQVNWGWKGLWGISSLTSCRKQGWRGGRAGCSGPCPGPWMLCPARAVRRTSQHQGHLVAGTQHRCSVVGLEALSGWAAAGVSYQKPLFSSPELKSCGAPAPAGAGLNGGISPSPSTNAFPQALQPCSFSLGASLQP